MGNLDSRNETSAVSGVRSDRFRVLTDPVEDLREAEFVTLQGTDDEFVGIRCIEFQNNSLLPSMKPWLLASDSINAAASSSMEL